MKKNTALLLSLFYCYLSFAQSIDEWNEQARDKLSSKKYAEAIAAYTEIIKINPTDSLAYFDRGFVKELIQDYSSAIADFSKAITVDSTNPDNYYLRGMCEFHLKNNLAAEKDFTKSLEIEPENADVLYYRGLTKLDLNRYKEALDDFKKAIEFRTDFSVEAYKKSAWAHAKMKHYCSAIKDCKLAKKLESKNQEIKSKHHSTFCWCTFYKHAKPD